MSIKYRIALLVTAAGFIASLLFSGVIFYELIEQPFDILDMELFKEAEYTAGLIESEQLEMAKEGVQNQQVLKSVTGWIRVFDNSGLLLYQSELAGIVDLPFIEAGSTANEDVVVSDNAIDFDQGNNTEVPFRIRTFNYEIKGKKLLIESALPMVKLKEEIHEVILIIIAGLVFSTLFLIVFSYFVAGKILKPIGKMKDLTQVIGEKNLDKRIPVGKGQDEFIELAQTINRMLDRLQLSFENQRNFLFDTSHELKTPLTTIRLAIDDICSIEDIADLPPSQAENLLRVKEHVIRMEKLVKDLLNLSALEVTNSVEQKPVHMNEILTSLIEDYRLIAEDKNIKVEMNATGQQIVSGDCNKLNRAFSNILDNAIKYNTPEGKIRITAEQSGSEVKIITSNTGPGVPEEEIPKIFNQFYRVEKSRSVNHGGSGLGLAIVKRTVELHRGSIDFESHQGEWTSVIICLPQYRNSKIKI